MAVSSLCRSDEKAEEVYRLLVALRVLMIEQSLELTVDGEKR